MNERARVSADLVDSPRIRHSARPRDGSFLLGPLVAGTYRLRAEAESAPRVPGHRAKVDLFTIDTVHAEAGERDIVLQLRAGG